MIRLRWRRVRRAIAWVLAAVVAAAGLLLSPVAYVELACRGERESQTYRPHISDPAFRRPEANAYLTYPEWHIVYAYDGLAHLLKTRDEHTFDYVPSIGRFWQSVCTLTRVADRHGGADWGTRSMVHTIGVSFTAEMLVKGLYEETVGRATAQLRGSGKTPQDVAIAATARDYARFLRQTPWYRYPFTAQARQLWAARVEHPVRSWERRLGIGLELQAKAAYAKVLAGAVAATGQAPQVNRSIITGLDRRMLASIPDVKVIGPRGDGVEIETPRYARFTEILIEIARRGGTIREIAGNDAIMVSLTIPADGAATVAHGTILLRVRRDGIAGERLLVGVPLADLAALLKAHSFGDPGLEHVFDY